MFNKGKPYVPPPTRAMGSAHPHDDVHDIHDELELEAELQVEDGTPLPGPNAFSHAAEERGDSAPLITPPPVSPAQGGSDGPSPSPFASSAPPTGAAPVGVGLSPAGPSTGPGIGGRSGGGNTPPSRPTREAASVLGNGMTFEGDISGVGQLVIEGTIKGDVRVSNVLINDKGSVEGTVHADVLEVRGRVTGAIVAKQVHLHATSRVEGDITQEQLTVDRGAWFSGRSTQARRGEEEILPSEE